MEIQPRVERNREILKCQQSPYYFATKYIKVKNHKGETVSFNSPLSEEKFNKMFNKMFKNCKMEQQQETLEEAAKKYSKKMWGVYFNDIHPDIAITETQGEISINNFLAGAEYQAEKMYSEEEVLNIINQVERFINKDKSTFTEIPNWFIEQFKKK